LWRSAWSRSRCSGSRACTLLKGRRAKAWAERTCGALSRTRRRRGQRSHEYCRR
jgi:hypothetical protein